MKTRLNKIFKYSLFTSLVLFFSMFLFIHNYNKNINANATTHEFTEAELEEFYSYFTYNGVYTVGLQDDFKTAISSNGSFVVDDYTWNSGDPLPNPLPNGMHGGTYYTSLQSMFSNLINTETLDITLFDTSRIENMSNMFASSKTLTTIKTNSLISENLTKVTSMFRDCYALTTILLDGELDFSNVTDTNYMFETCQSLEEFDLTRLDLSSVTEMKNMFRGCNKIKELDFSESNLTSVTNMAGAFGGCHVLTNINFDNIDTTNVTSMKSMFDYCTSLKSLDLSNFNTANVTTMEDMFLGCKELENLDISSFDTTKVTSMKNMFNNCQLLSDIDITGFNTSNVTTMASMFYNCKALVIFDITNFDTKNVTNMSSMFCGCNNLKCINLSGLDARNCTNFNSMFLGDYYLEIINMEGFKLDLTKSINFSSMFFNAGTYRQDNATGTKIFAAGYCDEEYKDTFNDNSKTGILNDRLIFNKSHEHEFKFIYEEGNGFINIYAYCSNPSCRFYQENPIKNAVTCYIGRVNICDKDVCFDENLNVLPYDGMSVNWDESFFNINLFDVPSTTIKYYVDENWTTSAPSNPGSYKAKVTCLNNDLEFEFKINKITIDFQNEYSAVYNGYYFELVSGYGLVNSNSDTYDYSNIDYLITIDNNHFDRVQEYTTTITIDQPDYYQFNDGSDTMMVVVNIEKNTTWHAIIPEDENIKYYATSDALYFDEIIVTKPYDVEQIEEVEYCLVENSSLAEYNWRDFPGFVDLEMNTHYFLIARYKDSNDHSAGTPSLICQVKTSDYLLNVGGVKMSVGQFLPSSDNITEELLTNTKPNDESGWLFFDLDNLGSPYVTLHNFKYSNQGFTFDRLNPNVGLFMLNNMAKDLTIYLEGNNVINFTKGEENREGYVFYLDSSYLGNDMIVDNKAKTMQTIEGGKFILDNIPSMTNTVTFRGTNKDQANLTVNLTNGYKASDEIESSFIYANNITFDKCSISSSAIDGVFANALSNVYVFDSTLNINMFNDFSENHYHSKNESINSKYETINMFNSTINFDSPMTAMRSINFDNCNINYEYDVIEDVADFNYDYALMAHRVSFKDSSINVLSMGGILSFANLIDEESGLFIENCEGSITAYASGIYSDNEVAIKNSRLDIDYVEESTDFVAISTNGDTLIDNSIVNINTSNTGINVTSKGLKVSNSNVIINESQYGITVFGKVIFDYSNINVKAKSCGMVVFKESYYSEELNENVYTGGFVNIDNSFVTLEAEEGMPLEEFDTIFVEEDIYIISSSYEYKVAKNESEMANSYVSYKDKPFSYTYLDEENNKQVYRYIYFSVKSNIDINTLCEKGLLKVSLGDELVYNGEEQTKVVNVDYNLFNIEFVINGNKEKNANDYTLHISSKDPHITGSIDLDYSISQISIDEFIKENLEDKVYTGLPITNQVSDYNLVENVDYRVTYVNNINSGKANVTIEGIGNYYGFVQRTFNISKATAVINVDTSDITVTYGESFTLPVATTNIGEVTVDKTLEDLVNAGTYVVCYDVANDENIIGSIVSILVTINKAEAVITVNTDEIVKEYGDSFTLPVATTNIGEVIVDKTIDEVLSVGSHVVSYVVNSDDNIIGTIVEVPITINKKNIEEAEVVLGDEVLVEDGTLKVQTVKSVKINGKDVTYSVSNNSNDKAGTYELTITGTENYTGAITRKYVILPKADSELKEVETEEGKKVFEIGDGTINVDLRKGNENAPTSTLTSDKVELIVSTLDGDDLAKVANGENVDIWVEVSDNRESITGESIELIEEAVLAYDGNVTIGMFIDISLFKKMESDENASRLHNTNNPIEVAIEIPEELVKSNRTYYIVRNHEGVVDIIEGSYDKKSNLFTFETDLFSDYAIAYEENCVICNSRSPLLLNICLLAWIVIVVIVMAIIATFIIFKKKKEKNHNNSNYSKKNKLSLE